MTAAPDPGRAVAPEAPGTAGLLRAGASISAWNLVSRLTGFVRVLAVGAAVGATFLGNTYQSANLVSNVLFELLAAGILSSVLVPTFVAALAAGGEDEAEGLAGAVLGVLLAVLGPVVVAGMVFAPSIMRGLTVAVRDPAVRDAQVDLGAFFLLFFLPQVLLYAVGAVATGLLHAGNRFAAASAAPVANNLAVTATMAAYWALRAGTPTLSLSSGEKVLLGAGTTVGVLAMTAIPVVAAWRAGLRLRPRWDLGHPGLRGMARRGAWAAVYLGLTQLLIVVTLVLANRVEGGAVAFQIAFTFFLLPFALVAHPLMTALYPRLAADAHGRAWAAFRGRLGDGLRLLALLVIPASALLVAIAQPALRLVSLGALAAGGPLVARTLAAYAAGLAGYAAFQLLTRAAYAEGDTRSPTLVNIGVAGGGALLMLLWSSSADGGDRVVVLGLAHSAAHVAGAAALLAVLWRRLSRRAPGVAAGLLATLARAVAAALAGGGAAYAVVRVIDAGDRAGAGLAVAAAGPAGVAVCAAVLFALGAPELRRKRPVPLP